MSLAMIVSTPRYHTGRLGARQHSFCEI